MDPGMGLTTTLFRHMVDVDGGQAAEEDAAGASEAKALQGLETGIRVLELGVGGVVEVEVWARDVGEPESVVLESGCPGPRLVLSHNVSLGHIRQHTGHRESVLDDLRGKTYVKPNFNRRQFFLATAQPRSHSHTLKVTHPPARATIPRHDLYRPKPPQVRREIEPDNARHPNHDGVIRVPPERELLIGCNKPYPRNVTRVADSDVRHSHALDPSRHGEIPLLQNPTAFLDRPIRRRGLLIKPPGNPQPRPSIALSRLEGLRIRRRRGVPAQGEQVAQAPDAPPGAEPLLMRSQVDGALAAPGALTPAGGVPHPPPIGRRERGPGTLLGLHDPAALAVQAELDGPKLLAVEDGPEGAGREPQREEIRGGQVRGDGLANLGG
ncbi:unnamed protein product [Parascedosporium putredinis]|uniref:Uncharacterized protein n=1 Tax=Parascedosporium putredinis TaxID=1442378 RepID=A0A9P1H0W6_9PEZI|nr:unnamed protein product [Parascedosporium putredinis]CAI7994354.1 unnamed protein product [Parascedosporium putredinis]